MSPAPVPRRGPSVVVGVGEPMRSDDGVGPAVVAALAHRLPAGTRCVPRVAETTQLLDVWDQAELAVVVDAMRSDADPGTVRRLSGAEVTELAARQRTTSSHGLSLRDAVALGQALGRMPRRLAVYLVEVGSVGPGEGLSAAVQRGVESAAAQIAEELSSAGSGD